MSYLSLPLATDVRHNNYSEETVHQSMEVSYASADRDQGQDIHFRGFVFTLSDKFYAQIWRFFADRSALDKFYRYQQVSSSITIRIITVTFVFVRLQVESRTKRMVHFAHRVLVMCATLSECSLCFCPTPFLCLHILLAELLLARPRGQNHKLWLVWSRYLYVCYIVQGWFVSYIV